MLASILLSCALKLPCLIGGTALVFETMKSWKYGLLSRRFSSFSQPSLLSYHSVTIMALYERPMRYLEDINVVLARLRGDPETKVPAFL